MTIRSVALLLAITALLAACAAPGPAPAPDPACAQPPAAEDKKDGGLGGTGNVPDPCAETPAGS